ncbi:hypothetical protein B0T20DRAFT_388895 [Sordaria brevicollis]|uniref:Uncharacterized protein n=1 Tax=Sordaria brevicollis TaxID=83679 RepID=A0AAE0UGC1_SORBR|nr:hypothetical protein B0T20DRAFT_388895 [Sordaria brevicollis]
MPGTLARTFEAYFSDAINRAFLSLAVCASLPDIVRANTQARERPRCWMPSVYRPSLLVASDSDSSVDAISPLPELLALLGLGEVLIESFHALCSSQSACVHERGQTAFESGGYPAVSSPTGNHANGGCLRVGLRPR